MAIANASLNFNTLNVSVQVGDVIYYTKSLFQVPFGAIGAMEETFRLGPVLEITTLPDGSIEVLVEYDDDKVDPPRPEDFISFSKSKKINTSSLLGYYASVNFVNNSTGKAELFSVGSEVSESSK